MHSSLAVRSLGLISLGLAAPFARAADTPSAAADLAHGQLLFQQTCALCHGGGPAPIGATVAPAGGQGPSLGGVVGRRAGSGANFNYTKVLTDSGLTWNAATLDRFLQNPTTAVPGTNMVIIVPQPDDRRDLIAFLATLKAAPPSAADAAPVRAPASDPYDWRHAGPGTPRQIVVEKLPEPFSTSSARNNPSVVPQPANATLSVPAGFKVELFAKGLSGPRVLRVAPNGDIFVAETRANRITVLRAADGASSPATNEIFASGVDRPFGIAFYPAGNDPQWIYIANNNSVVRFPYHNGDLKATGVAQVIVPKLSDTTGGHTTRDVAFSPDGKRLFISVGSSSNVAEGTAKKTADEVRAWEAENGLGAAWGPEFHRANVLVTDPEGKAPLKVFASGIRNPVGLAIEPVTGDLWTSTNERDGLGDDLVPDYVTSVKENHYYGWPWYYLGNHEDPRLAGARPDLAGKATVPDVLLQAHSAALEIAFYTATTGSAVFPASYRGDLFVASHGSWNRNSRTGYKVLRAKMQNGKPTGAYDDFLTGFVVDDRSVWGRPVGVAVAHDGALLVSEDGNATIWRVSPVGR